MCAPGEASIRTRSSPVDTSNILHCGGPSSGLTRRSRRVGKKTLASAPSEIMRSKDIARRRQLENQICSVGFTPNSAAPAGRRHLSARPADLIRFSTTAQRHHRST